MGIIKYSLLKISPHIWYENWSIRNSWKFHKSFIKSSDFKTRFTQNNTSISDPFRKAEILAFNFEANFSPNTIPDPEIRRLDHLSDLVIQQSRFSPEIPIFFFSPTQILTNVKSLKNHKEPDPDNILNFVLKHLPQKEITHFPSQWKKC